MLEDVLDMYNRARAEAAQRLEAGDFTGYSRAMAFAFKCRQFASELMD